MNELDLFSAALDLPSPQERARYLEEACGADHDLRRRIEELLGAFAHAGSFMGVPASDRVQEATTAEPINEAAGTVIGPYKLLQPIGEGGMGVVWMAEQSQPVQRKVALKIIKAGLDSRQVLARFEAERRALALMDHPHIAKVLDGGATPQGRPYFVMELVKGQPITAYCDQHRLTPRQRLELFVPVCQAVQHAHQKGIIHRDLKPSNVLVAPYDGKPVVKVIDFGIAKAAGPRLTERTLFTEFGQVVGTLEYMSPEQAELNNQDIDTRSDIYTLGVLLYELLTGTTPLTKKRVKEAGLLDVLRLVREEEPPRPSTRLSESKETLPSISAQRQTEPAKLTRLMRGELDWIVMKALEKDRNRRYETANALAADLDRYLADEPVQACPPSAGYRLRKFARRHKVALAMAASGATALLVLVVGSVLSAAFVWQANWDLQQALGREQQALSRERDTTYFQRIALAERELAAIHGARAEALLELCPEEQRGWEWHFLKRRLLEEPWAPDQPIRSVGGVAFSSNGQLLAATDHDGFVHLWDPRSGAWRRTLTAESPGLARVAISPDGQRLAAARWNGPITVWDLVTGQSRLLPGQFKGVAFRPDGRHLASGSRDGTVIVWDVVTWGKTIYSGHSDIVHDVAYSPDGSWLASVSDDQSVRLWDVGTGQPRLILKGHQDAVNCVAFSQDGQYLATGSHDRTVRNWDVVTGSEIRVLRGHNHAVLAVAFSPNGRRLASGGADRTVKLWDLATGQEALTLREFKRNVRALAFSPDGLHLASGGHGRGDVPLRIWDGTPLDEEGSPEPLRTFSGHTLAVQGLTFSPDGSLVASAGCVDKTVRVRKARTGQEVHTWVGESYFESVAFSPDGSHVAACGENGTLKVWDLRANSEVLALTLSPLSLRDLKYSPDGGRLALADEGGLIRILDVESGKELNTLNGQVASINAVAFSPDGKYLASGGDEATVRIWDMTARKPVQVLQGHQAAVWGVVYSPDGKRLVTAAADGLVLQWDVTDGQVVRRIRAHRDAINSMKLSTDGRCLATGSRDDTVKFWDATTGGLLGLVRARQQEVLGVAFDPKGKYLASSGVDGTVKIWAVPAGAAPSPGK